MAKEMKNVKNSSIVKNCKRRKKIYHVSLLLIFLHRFLVNYKVFYLVNYKDKYSLSFK